MDIVELTQIAWEWQIEILLPLIVVVLALVYTYRIITAMGDGMGNWLERKLKGRR